jgi:hypothetical protein
MLAAKQFSENVTNHLLLECAINSAKNEDHIIMLYKWITTGIVTDLKGVAIEGLEISTRHRHLMTRRIYSGTSIDEDKKKQLLVDLAEIDQSDWMDKTRYFCQAAIPYQEVKQ